MKIAIVIPFHNEKIHIAKVLKEIKKFKLPVVVVDDGSTDGSGEVVPGGGVTLLTHPVNLGKGAAMKTGAEYSFGTGSDAVIFMDADGQHSPDDLKVFIKTLNSQKYEVVLGSRRLSNKAPLVRYLGNKIASLVIYIFFGVRISDPLCGYRAMTRTAYEKINWESVGYAVESEILARVGQKKLKHIEVPVETIYHDKDKGVTLLDAFSVLGDVIKWKISR